MKKDFSGSRYYSLVHLQDKHLDLSARNTYHLTMHIYDTTLKVSVIDPYREQCVLLAEYHWSPELTPHYVQVLQEIYQEEPLLSDTTWATATLTISNQQYSIVPQALFQSQNLREYLAFICPQDLSTLKYFTHPGPAIVLTFALDPLLVQWFEKVYSETPRHYIHQASSLLEGSMHYLQELANRGPRCTFLFIESCHFHIIIVEQQQLFYYNRFAYEAHEKLLHYFFVVMQTLDLEPSLEEVILAGEVTKGSGLYKEITRHIKKVRLYEGPPHLRPLQLRQQEDALKYFDVLSTILLHKA